MNYLVVVDENGNTIIEEDHVWCVMKKTNDDVGTLEQVYKDKIWPSEQINEYSEEVLPSVNDENSHPNINHGKSIDKGLPEPTPGTSSISSSNDRIQWNAGATKFLSDTYSTNLQNIGAFKQFRDEKTMYIHISEQLNKKLGFQCTGLQCEQRFETVVRKQSSTVTHNKKSGNTRQKIEYEEELSKLKAIDDSMEPDVLMGIGILKIGKTEDLLVIPRKKEKQNITVNVQQEMEKTQKRLEVKSKNKNTKRSLEEIYEESQRIKEENRKKWRQEKLSVFKEYVKSLADSNEKCNADGKCCTHCSEVKKP